MGSQIYATPSQRFSAYIIDGVIIIILTQMTMAFFEKIIINFYPVSYIISVLFLNLIFAFRDIKGQSIGKRIMKIKVITLERKKISYLQSILRYVTLFIGPVDMWVYWGNGFKERLGDKISKTRVVQMK